MSIEKAGFEAGFSSDATRTHEPHRAAIFKYAGAYTGASASYTSAHTSNDSCRSDHPHRDSVTYGGASGYHDESGHRTPPPNHQTMCCESASPASPLKSSQPHHSGSDASLEIKVRKTRRSLHKAQRRLDLIRTGPLAGQPKLARRPTDRTRAIALEQLKELCNAFTFTESAYLPLNGGLVIIWRHSLLYDWTNWSPLQTTLFSYSIKFLRRLGLETRFIWTRERASGNGAHTHVLIYLGESPMPVFKALRNELMRKFGFTADGLYPSMGDFGMRTREMRAGHLRYILKAFDPNTFRYTGIGAETQKLADVLGIQDREPQGIIGMKRCGTSQNIGVSARRTAGWQEIADLARLRGILYPDNVHDSFHGDILF
jgi:hypothetical protein